MEENNWLAVILAGGSGTRFWPLSKKSLPKQYLSLFGDRSLVQQTVDRLEGLIPPARVYTISTVSQRALLQSQLPQVKNHLFEPEGKNTAPCLMLTAADLITRQVPPETVLICLPADHHIADPEAFRSALKQAAAFAAQHDALVTFGIQPNCPHTGYGYIEGGERAGNTALQKVRRFVEKPNAEKAAQFLAHGNFYWNSGMFVWTLKSISRAFDAYLGDQWRQLLATPHTREREALYRTFPAAPIDTAVLEKAPNVFVLPASMGWSDVGSWGALYDLQNKDAAGNAVLSGQSTALQSKGCLVSLPAGKKIALVGVDDLIVVESDGYLLVCRRDRDQLVREAAKALDL